MKYSYHVMQNFRSDWVFMWPYGVGDYCDSYRRAKYQYDEMIHHDPTGRFRLVKYQPVLKGFICKTIVGIKGTPIVVQEINA